MAMPLPRFDKVSISAEGAAFQALKITRLGYADGADTLSLDVAGESVEEKEWLKADPNGDDSSVVLDITDHAALEASQRRNEKTKHGSSMNLIRFTVRRTRRLRRK